MTSEEAFIQVFTQLERISVVITFILIITIVSLFKR